MRISTLAVCALVSGCAGRYRAEFVGTGTAIVQPRSEIATTGPTDAVATPWAVGGGIQLAAGTYDLAMAFDVPRAQEIEWTVSCPGVQLNGTAGETFEHYRERRLAELRAQVQRDRERTAAVTSAVVGAFTPRVVATHHTGPVTIHGEAGVDANAVGEAVAESAIPDDVALPPGDVGRGRFGRTVHLTTTGNGMCVVTAFADDASVLGTYQVTRIRDLDAEARVAVMSERSAAMSVRARLQSRLVAHGADPEVSIRERRAAAEAHYAAEARANAEIELRARMRAEQEEQWRITALHARAELRGRCQGHGADPHYRERIAEEQRIAGEARARLRVDIEQRRLDLALGARTSLRSRLVRFGAIARPPMPALIAETPGTPPFDGAIWIAGKWTWTAGRWQWTAGGWGDSDVFTAAGDNDYIEPPVEDTSIVDDIIDVGMSVGVGLGVGAGDRRAHRNELRESQQGRVRDHRTPTTSVRDHRDTPTSWTPSKSDPPPRDDRKRDEDKRDDKKSDDGGTRMIRDHRH